MRLICKPPPRLCVSDALEQSLDPGVTEWERSREREEFVRASILYRPTSSSLSSRFTRAKQQEDDDSVEVSRDQEVGRNTAVQTESFKGVVHHFTVVHERQIITDILTLDPTFPIMHLDRVFN